MLERLDVELFTYVVDNEEYDGILRAFLLAGVIDIETPTDIGLATTMYMASVISSTDIPFAPRVSAHWGGSISTENTSRVSSSSSAHLVPESFYIKYTSKHDI